MQVPQDAGGDVSAAANGNHEVWLKFMKDALCRCLAQLVHLYERSAPSALVNERAEE